MYDNFFIGCAYGDKAINCVTNEIVCEQFPDECCDTCKDMLNVSATSSSSQTTPASTQSTGASTVSQGTTAETEQPTTSADSNDLEGTYHFKAKPNIRKFSCMSFLTTERDLSLGRPLCERPSIQSVFRRTPKPSWIVQADRSFRLAFTQYCRSDCVMAHFSFY